MAWYPCFCVCACDSGTFTDNFDSGFDECWVQSDVGSVATTSNQIEMTPVVSFHRCATLSYTSDSVMSVQCKQVTLPIPGLRLGLVLAQDDTEIGTGVLFGDYVSVSFAGTNQVTVDTATGFTTTITQSFIFTPNTWKLQLTFPTTLTCDVEVFLNSTSIHTVTGGVLGWSPATRFAHGLTNEGGDAVKVDDYEFTFTP